MNRLLRVFAQNPVAANMLMFGIVVLGLLVLPMIQREVLPPLVQDSLTLTVSMQGVGPEQTEKALCLPVERAIRSHPDIDAIHSVASPGRCRLNLQLSYSSDIDVIAAEIERLTAKLPLPAAASTVSVDRNHQDLMLMRLTLSGPVAYDVLLYTAKRVAEDLRDRGLSKVRLRDVREHHLLIEISEATLARYQLTLAEVAAMINAAAVELPAGQLLKSDGVASIVVPGAYHHVADLESLLLRSGRDGSQLRLRDIARVVENHSDSALESRLNAQQAISVSIYQDEVNDVAAISKTVVDYMQGEQRRLPQFIDLTLVQDNSAYFNQRMRMLGENALAGLVLVFICLALFLRLRLAFWVSAGLPLAFLGGLLILFLLGESINMVSTFALLLVLGVVVDDAIIIAENIYARQQHLGLQEGAIKGVQELAKPVIFAVLTTAMTFVPLAFLPGLEGRLLAQIPMVVVATLLFSLIECLIILPAHLAHSQGVLIKAIKHGLNGREQHGRLSDTRMALSLQWLIDHSYKPLLEQCLRWRYALLSLFLGVLAFCAALILSGRTPIDWLSSVDAEVATGFVSFDKAGGAQRTSAAVTKIEAAALSLKDELHQRFGVDQVSHIRALVDSQGLTGQVFMNLENSQQRLISGDEIMQLWRQKVGDIKAASSLSFSAKYQGSSAGQLLDMELESVDSQALYLASKALLTMLQGYEELDFVSDSYVNEHEEVRVTLKPSAQVLGFTRELISQQISAAFMGISLPSLHQEGSDKAVYLRLPVEQRNSLAHLQNLPVRLGDGSHLPLQSLADISFDIQPAAINRYDGRRVAHISATYDFNRYSQEQLLTRIKQDFSPILATQFPAVDWRQSKVDHHKQLIKQRLILGFIVALLVMYMLMASLFHSYFQPLIILSAVPFALIGAMAGHLLFWQPLTIWSMAGIVAVSGIVVNDNMVLIYAINSRLSKGESLVSAVSEAGVKRFRPILLTTITTFFALMPMMFEGSWEAQFLVPMAIAIGFGELFATAVSLLLVPALYLIGKDISAVAEFNVK